MLRPQAQYLVSNPDPELKNRFGPHAGAWASLKLTAREVASCSPLWLALLHVWAFYLKIPKSGLSVPVLPFWVTVLTCSGEAVGSDVILTVMCLPGARPLEALLTWGWRVDAGRTLPWYRVRV